jgi:DNA-binding transcriptional regulator YiaG
LCQSIAGPPVDEAIGLLIAEQMTPAAVELALEVRKEIQARHEEADRLRCRAIERARTEADLAQRRFMLVDPNNRLVADTLEGEWNEKLRILANAREERERAREHDQFILDEAVRERLVAMTVDFNKLWADPDTPNRERKRLLAHIIEDVTLVKLPAEGTTKVHVRFKGGKIQTLTTLSPKSSAQQVKTQPGIVELVDKLLDDHIYSEIAELLNQQGYRPGEAARRGRSDARFTASRVAYLVHQYTLRSRYDRLRERGMLTKQEAAARLNVHEHTVTRWAKHGLVTSHAYNGHYCLYEIPGSDLPQKQCSRWNRLVDRAATYAQNASQTKTLN